MRPQHSLWILLACGMFGSGCGGGDHPAAPGPTDISGPITTSATWSGTVRLTANGDIGAGVDITVAAGTAFVAAQDAVLQVHGSLAIDGTAQHPVSMELLDAATSWGGIVVEAGGAAAIHYATGGKVATLLVCKSGALACVIDHAQFGNLGQAVDASAQVAIQNSTFAGLSGNAVVVKAGGNVNITDSTIWAAPGDLVLVSGGQLTVSYCRLGTYGTSQHGDIFVSSSTGLSVTHSDLSFAVDAVSIGGTTGALFQYNNFLNNGVHVLDLGSNASISMPNNYWDGAAPSLGSAFAITSSSLTPIAGTGPR